MNYCCFELLTLNGFPGWQQDGFRNVFALKVRSRYCRQNVVYDKETIAAKHSSRYHHIALPWLAHFPYKPIQETSNSSGNICGLFHYLNYKTIRWHDPKLRFHCVATFIADTNSRMIYLNKSGFKFVFMWLIKPIADAYFHNGE